MRDGALDRTRPVQLRVNQVYAVDLQTSSGVIPIEDGPDSPLCGRPLGSNGDLQQFLARWQAALDVYCRREEIAKLFRLTQGCVIERTDGTYFQLRNFANDQPWMRGSPFRNIQRVYRSPFRFLATSDDAGT